MLQGASMRKMSWRSEYSSSSFWGCVCEEIERKVDRMKEEMKYTERGKGIASWYQI